jgi:hypothetical protein
MQSSQVGVNGRSVLRAKLLATDQAAQNLDDHHGRILRHGIADRDPGKDA